MGKYLLRVILLCAIVPFYGVSQSANEDGELTIYPMMTQMGTLACRTYRDNQGHITKEIFYTGTPTARPPYRKEMLKVQSTVLYKYNEQGQKVRSEHYKANMELEHIWEIHYEDDEHRREIKLSAPGTKSYEIRYSGNASISHLYYDENGKTLKAIRGTLPEDIDLPFGWGEPVDGLACGITVTKEKSWIDEKPIQAFTINIKNSGTRIQYLFQLPPPQIELRDRLGQLVQAMPDQKRLQKLEQHFQLYGQTIPPGASGYVYPAYELQAHYTNLAPGRYRLRVKQPIKELKTTLLSNAAFIDIK